MNPNPPKVTLSETQNLGGSNRSGCGISPQNPGQSPRGEGGSLVRAWVNHQKKDGMRVGWSSLGYWRRDATHPGSTKSPWLRWTTTASRGGGVPCDAPWAHQKPRAAGDNRCLKRRGHAKSFGTTETGAGVIPTTSGTTDMEKGAVLKKHPAPRIRGGGPHQQLPAPQTQGIGVIPKTSGATDRERWGLIQTPAPLIEGNKTTLKTPAPPIQGRGNRGGRKSAVGSTLGPPRAQSLLGTALSGGGVCHGTHPGLTQRPGSRGTAPASRGGSGRHRTHPGPT